MSQPFSPEMERLRIAVFVKMGAFAAVGVVLLGIVLHRLNVSKFSLTNPIATIFLLAGVVGFMRLATDRTSYLPFLGECVLPQSVLKAKTPRDATAVVNIKVPKHAKYVIYWASESSVGIAPNPWDAYGNYENAGVTTVSSDGTATLAIRCPAQYRVRGRALPKHVHYRAIYASGIGGPVETTDVSCI